MEESAYEALFTGTYIFVFIVALTVTIYLFNSMLDFSDLAYEFNTTVEDKSTIINAPVEENRLLTGEEVLSYYYNYVRLDLYTAKESPINYNITIKKTVTGSSINSALEGKSLNDVANEIGIDNRYILYYKGASYDAEGKKNIDIEIVKATQEQIDSML